jgi:tetratricopeptide (TPR) repeat protein
MTQPDKIEPSWDNIMSAWKADNYATAAQLCRAYLRRRPENGPTWCVLGIVLYKMACYEEARDTFQKALEYGPKRTLVLYNLGHLYREWGKYAEAAEWYRQAIEDEPDDATGYIYLGAVLAKAGDLSAAEELHRAATRCKEGCIDEAYLNLGLVLRAQQRFTEAAEAFRKALELTPDYDAALSALTDVEACEAFVGRARVVRGG